MARLVEMRRRQARGIVGAAGLAFAGLAFGALCGYAEEGAIWKPVGKAPDKLKICRVILTGEHAGIIAGTLEGEAPAGADLRAQREADRARIFSSTDGGMTFVSALDTQGEMEALDFCDPQTGWAVVARVKPAGEGSLYFLFSTQDGGVSWHEVAQVPARSIKQVVRAAPDRGWVLGAGTLMHSTDQGKTWIDAAAPGKRNSAKERIAAAGADGLSIAGPALLRTADGGAKWDTVDLGAAKAQLAQGEWLVLAEGDAVSFGKLEKGAVKKLGALPKGVRAERIVAEGATVRILASSITDDQPQVLVLTSTDGGATFRSETVPVTATGCVGLWGAKAGWAVTLDRQVLAGN